MVRFSFSSTLPCGSSQLKLAVIVPGVVVPGRPTTTILPGCFVSLLAFSLDQKLTPFMSPWGEPEAFLVRMIAHFAGNGLHHWPHPVHGCRKRRAAGTGKAWPRPVRKR